MFARERTKVTLKIKGLRGRSAAGTGVTGQRLSMVRNAQRHSAPLGAGSGEEKMGGTIGKRRSVAGPVEFFNPPE